MGGGEVPFGAVRRTSAPSLFRSKGCWAGSYRSISPRGNHLFTPLGWSFLSRPLTEKWGKLFRQRAPSPCSLKSIVWRGWEEGSWGEQGEFHVLFHLIPSGTDSSCLGIPHPSSLPSRPFPCLKQSIPPQKRDYFLLLWEGETFSPYPIIRKTIRGPGKCVGVLKAWAPEYISFLRCVLGDFPRIEEADRGINRGAED